MKQMASYMNKMTSDRKKEIKELLRHAAVWNDHSLKLHTALLEAMGEVDRQGEHISALILDHIAAEGEWIGWTRGMKGAQDRITSLEGEITRLKERDWEQCCAEWKAARLLEIADLEDKNKDLHTRLKRAVLAVDLMAMEEGDCSTPSCTNAVLRPPDCAAPMYCNGCRSSND